MTPQTKQRIEQIQRGEVPKGYKKTKIGIVPDEWKSYKLCEISTELHECAGDGNYETLSISAGVGFVNQANKFGKEISGAQYSKYTVLNKGDFSYNKGNSKKYPQGCIYQLKDRDVAAVPNVFESFRLIKGNNDFFEQLFMYGFLNSQLFSKINHGVRDDGLLNLRGNDFYSSYVLFPPLTEQEKIAEILSAQDKLISLKEKLIEKKKQEKKALMQRLLTGKKRLVGFDKNWDVCNLRTLAVPINKKTGTERYEILSISAGIGFVNQAKKFGKEIAGEQYKNYTVLHKYEFSYNKGNSKKYPQGCIYPLEDRECAAVPNVFISFKLDENRCCYGFYKYLFEYGYLNKQLYRLINSGVRNDGLLNLYDEDFYNCVIPVPSYNEQKRIAEIFFSLDREIVLLENTLEEEKQKKKALMQLLLTGIVRTI